MGPRSGRRSRRWAVQLLSPLREGPDPDAYRESNKKESSWEFIRALVRLRREKSPFVAGGGGASPPSFYDSPPSKRPDLRLMLGVLACPLAPVAAYSGHSSPLSLRDAPIETSSAKYIIQQYLAATGCLKPDRSARSMYATGSVKMVCCEAEVGLGAKRPVHNASKALGESGCFVLWQMHPDMWSLELVVAGHKVVAGSNGKVVWRHTPWLGLHAAKGPHRSLRRITQGLDPKSTASLFTDAQCLGEKRIGGDDCFVLKVAVDRTTAIDRSEGPTEVIRHALFGYFSQRSGLLVYMEDSHLIRVEAAGGETIYWETTIGSFMDDYREVDGIVIAHQGRSMATIFRFGEASAQHSRTRMEEGWRVDDVVFNVPGLSMDYFIPPADLFEPNSKHYC